MDNFDRHFDRQSARTQKIMIYAIIAKLAIAGGLIWLAVYAINAFTA
ncbi:hypothetical protein SM764_17530 [Pseudophaeobacter sp. 1A16562]